MSSYLHLRPVFRFAGSKTGFPLEVASVTLKSLLEKRNDARLIEPFCGSASVSISSLPVYCHLADNQPHVTLALEVIRRYPISLLSEFSHYRERHLENASYGLMKESYLEIRSNPPKEPIKRAAWYLFILHTSFNRLWRVNKKGQCNASVGDKSTINRLKNGLERENFLAVSSWLNRDGVSVSLSDYKDTVKSSNEGDIIYLDPPYLGQFSSFSAKKFHESSYAELYRSLYDAWKRGVQIVMQCNADPGVAAQYINWCRVFVYPVRRSIQPKKNHVSMEMLIISQPKQMGLFIPAGPEETLLNIDSVGEAKWIPTKNKWEVWPPKGSMFQKKK